MKTIRFLIVISLIIAFIIPCSIAQADSAPATATVEWNSETSTITIHVYTTGWDWPADFNNGRMTFRSGCNIYDAANRGWVNPNQGEYTNTFYVWGDLDRISFENGAAPIEWTSVDPWHVGSDKSYIYRNLHYTCPEILGIAPAKGAPGAPYTIIGKNLLTESIDDHKIIWSTLSGTRKAVQELWQTQWGNETIAATVPEFLTPGTYRVKVVRGWFSSNEFIYQLLSKPTITSITPTQAAPGTQIVIDGTHFLDVPAGTGASDLQVWFIDGPGVNWMDAASAIDWTDKRIVLTLPSNLAENYDYLVRIYRAGMVSNPFEFTTGNKPLIYSYLPFVTK